MKKLILLDFDLRPVWFCLVLIFMADQNIVAQDVLLEAHAKPFRLQRSNADTKMSYSNFETNGIDESAVTDLGLTISIGDLKKLIYVADLNWVRENYRQDFTWSQSSPNSNNMQSSLITLGLEQLAVGIGVDRPIALHDRLITSFGGRLVYAHQFGYEFSRYDVITDTLGTLIATRDERRSFPNENTVGIEAVGRIYFKVIPRLSVGMNFINRFGFTFVKGSYIRENRSYDANGIETDYRGQVKTGVQNRFAYNFSVSFGIQYQLARRKEKKK